MKRFFRVAAWLVGLILVLVLIGQLYLMVRQSNAGKQLVHPDSKSILRVNVDKLLLEMGKNALLNRREYQRTDSAERIPLWRAGVSIPANVYFFLTPADSSVFYTLLTLKDKERFWRYIRHYMDGEIVELDNGLWGLDDGVGRFSFVGNDSHILMSFAVNKRDRITDMAALLSSTDWIAVQSLDMAPLSDSKAELSYYNLSNENFWQADFSNGEVEIAGRMVSDGWLLSDNPEARSMDSDNVLNVWLHADIRPALLQHREFFAQHAVDIDSIQPFIGNYWELQWKPNTIIQQDTVISYEYDDNFEMTELETVRDTPVPDIRFAVKASPHLMPYLPDKLFYRFRKHAANGLIQLLTDEETVPNTALEHVDSHFYLGYHADGDPNALTEQFPWMRAVKVAELKGHGEGTHTMKLEGHAAFEKKGIHPLKQLLERW